MTADFERAKAKAAEILEKYKFIKPPINPQIVAEAVEVDVAYAKFKPEISSEVSGLIRFNHDSGNRPQIIVNKDIQANRITFTIAHELGHYFLHKHYAKSENYQVMPRSNYYPDGKPKEEQEADCFAANLLVPETMLRKYSGYASIKSIEELAKMFAVSKDVILNRMRFLGI